MTNARCFLSHREQSLDALGELTEQLRSTTLAPHGAGLLIASEHHRPHAEQLRSTLTQKASLATLMGTITNAGVVHERAYFDQPFLALLRWEPEEKHAPHPLQISRLGDHNLDETIQAALILSSTSTVRAVLESVTLHDIFTMGAVTFASAPTLQFHRDGSIIAGATGLGWQNSESIATVLIPSAQDLCPPLEVTACHDDIVIELDGKPAVDVLCTLTGIKLEAAFDSLGTEYLVGIEHNAHDYTQRIYRHIIALDPRQKMFSVGHQLSKGARLTIGHRNPDGAMELIEEHCEQLKARLVDKKIDALIFQGCIARGPALFPTPHKEAELISKHFPEVPLIGVYGNGEFFGQELQSYAAVLTAILS